MGWMACVACLSTWLTGRNLRPRYKSLTGSGYDELNDKTKTYAAKRSAFDEAAR